MEKIITICFIWIILLITACKKNLDYQPGDPMPEAPIEGIKVPTNVFGRVVNEKDEPVSMATVTGGGKSAKTDENGYYFLDNVMLDHARGYINVQKPTYFKAYRVVPAVKDGLTEPTVIKLLPQKSIGKINAATGGKVSSAGGTKLELPADAIENYTGDINVVAAYLNPTRPDFFAMGPGSMAANATGNERVGLISYGMTYMELLDNAGNQVKLKTGAEATLTLPVPSTILKTAESTIPMWYFDETKGIWIEEGTGKLESGHYVGKVKHFTMWNYDKPAVQFSLSFNLEWYVPNITSISEADLHLLFYHPRPPNVVASVKEPNGNTVHSTVVHLNSNPSATSSNYTYTPSATHQSILTYPAHSDEVTITVTPIFPGGPEYPTATNHSANSDDPPFPETINEGETESTDITANIPPKPNTIVEIQIPKGGHQGGNGETIVNVNGKAVNCDQQPVTSGYVYLEMKSGNEMVRTVTAAIFGSEGRFSAQYLFMKPLPKKVDNISLTVYDMKTGKKSGTINHNVNPSVALQIPETVVVCANNAPTDPGNLKSVANATITDAASLKAFVDGGYESVTNKLHISSQEITDLSSITQLKQVNVMEIINTGLANIGGLAQLEAINGSIRVDNNPKLTGFVLPQLLNKKMAGGIYFSNNPLLVSVSLPALENINEIGQAILFDNDPALATFSIPALKTINAGGQLNIINTSLENLDMFSNATGTLPSSGAYGLNIIRNKKLVSIAGLKNIEVKNAFQLSDNPLLTSIDGLKLSGTLDNMFGYIVNNPLLGSVTLSFTKALTGGLQILNNAALKSINIPIATAMGAVEIANNNKLTTVQFPQLKTADGIAIHNENALSDIQAPALEALVNGQLYLGELKALTAIDFPALKTVNGSRFEIAHCEAITKYDGFNNLEKVTGNMSIHSNRSNTPVSVITGFKKLVEVTRSLIIRPSDDNNAPVTSITGFSSLTTVGESLQISGKNLTSLAGFKKLTSAGTLSVFNTSITNLNDFNGLKSVQGLDVHDNNKLANITGLSELTSLSHNLIIYSNAALTNLNGLEKITSIPSGHNSSIDISGNALLSNIEGLKNITAIQSNLKITGNLKLTSLCGLNKLVNGNGIGGSYNVSNNEYNPTSNDIKNGKCSK